MSNTAKSIKLCFNLKQMEKENVHEYFNRFKISTEIMESSIGGPIQLTKYVERMDGYDIKNTIRTQKLSKIAYDQLLAFLYMENSNQIKFKSVCNEVDNLYPKTISDANVVLGKFSNENDLINKNDNAGTNSILKDQTNSIFKHSSSSAIKPNNI